MYEAIYKCKLCEQTEIEKIKDDEIDISNQKYPLKTMFKVHECENKSIGVSELIGYRYVGS